MCRYRLETIVLFWQFMRFGYWDFNATLNLIYLCNNLSNLTSMVFWLGICLLGLFFACCFVRFLVWVLFFSPGEIKRKKPPLFFFSEDKYYVYVIKKPKIPTQKNLMSCLFVPDDCDTFELGKPFGVCVRDYRMNFITATKQIFRSRLVTESRWKGNQLRSVHCKLFPHD